MEMVDLARDVVLSFEKLKDLMGLSSVKSELLLISGFQTSKELDEAIDNSRSFFIKVAEGSTLSIPKRELEFGVLLHKSLIDYQVVQVERQHPV